MAGPEYLHLTASAVLQTVPSATRANTGGIVYTGSHAKIIEKTLGHVEFSTLIIACCY